MIQSKQIKEKFCGRPCMHGPEQNAGRLRVAVFEVPATTAVDSEFVLTYLPAGVVRILTALSRVVMTGVTGNFDLMLEDYRAIDGSMMLEANNVILDNAEAADGTIAQLGDATTVEGYQYKSQDMVTVKMSTGALVPAGATIRGFLVYVVD